LTGETIAQFAVNIAGRKTGAPPVANLGIALRKGLMPL